ncbi:MAG: hypothetical protein QXP76_03715, partial [Acidilobaceae archaeon]
MYRAKYLTKVPAILAGIPVPESKNPYIAAPVSDAIVNIEINECREPLVKVKGVPALEEHIGSLWTNLLENLGFNLCSQAEVLSSTDRVPLGGLYASLSSVLYYALAEAHGETPSSREIVEILSLADPLDVDESLRTAISALRYSATSGNVIAYRDLDEVYEFKATRLTSKVEINERAYRQSARISKESLSLDIYSSLVHLAGIVVLQIATDIKDGLELFETLFKHKPILDAIAIAVWDLDKPQKNCFWS